jgi:hypothetical protein
MLKTAVGKNEVGRESPSIASALLGGGSTSWFCSPLLVLPVVQEALRLYSCDYARSKNARARVGRWHPRNLPCVLGESVSRERRLDRLG